MVVYEAHEVLSYSLTPEGKQIADQGSHEARVWAALSEKGGNPVSIKDLKSKVGDESAKVGQGRAFKSGWIVKDGENLYKAVCDFYITSKSLNIDDLLFIDPNDSRCHPGGYEGDYSLGHSEGRREGSRRAQEAEVDCAKVSSTVGEWQIS